MIFPIISSSTVFLVQVGDVSLVTSIFLASVVDVYPKVDPMEGGKITLFGIRTRMQRV